MRDGVRRVHDSPSAAQRLHAASGSPWTPSDETLRQVGMEVARELATKTREAVGERMRALESEVRELRRQRGDEVIEQAIEDGRIDASRRETYVRLFEQDAAATVDALELLPPNPHRAAADAQASVDEDAHYRHFVAAYGWDPEAG